MNNKANININSNNSVSDIFNNDNKFNNFIEPLSDFGTCKK